MAAVATPKSRQSALSATMPRAKTARARPRSNRDALLARQNQSRVPLPPSTPGPGTYRPSSFTDISFRSATGVHYRLPTGTEKRMRDPKFRTPGPGTYNPVKPLGYRLSQTISLKGRCHRDKHMTKINYKTQNSWSPGPATYHADYRYSSQKSHGVSVVIHGSVKNHFEYKIGKDSPGPASYYPPLSKSVGTTPQTKFGKSVRVLGIGAKDAKSDQPGPGTYKLHELGRGIGIKGFMSGKPYIGGRPIPTKGSGDVPGPGHYVPKNEFADDLAVKGGMVSMGAGAKGADKSIVVI